jgi:hypothetical protein
VVTIHDDLSVLVTIFRPPRRPVRSGQLDGPIFVVTHLEHVNPDLAQNRGQPPQPHEQTQTSEGIVITKTNVGATFTPVDNCKVPYK